ncbi:unnamed protein product [Rhizophagus irregularis]|nr:unnamed protein product [Rhizophagus irregularis]
MRRVTFLHLILGFEEGSSRISSEMKEDVINIKNIDKLLFNAEPYKSASTKARVYGTYLLYILRYFREPS